MASVVREAGHDAVVTGVGLAALNAALTAEQPYDLVITNNCMPRMGGAELIARLVARVPAAVGDGAKSAAGQGCGRRGRVEGCHDPHQLLPATG